MNLTDLLVSYNQVKTPTEVQTPHVIEDRYTQNLRQVKDRKSKKTVKEETKTSGWEGWTLDSDDSPWFVSSKPQTRTVPQPTKETVVKQDQPQLKVQQVVPTFKPTYGRVDRWNSTYVDKKDQWVNDMVKAYREYGLSDNAIKNLIAKNALESGWGSIAQGQYNFGNITPGSTWTGNYVEGSDKDANGKKISQKFRSYDNINDYVNDEIDFLTRLYNFNQNDDINTFLSKLVDGKRKYAQAKDYKPVVSNIYKTTQWKKYKLG